MTWNRGKGRGITWLREHVNYDGPECLIWPWTRDGQGRGAVGIDGKLLRAHRVMCELVHGPAPTQGHHAAHSCGNGHNACVHPMHLSWKTKEENAQDRVQDGRNGGNPNGCTTAFTMEEFAELRRGLIDGRPIHELAARFGVARSVINYWDRKLRAGQFPEGKKPRQAKGFTRHSSGKLASRIRVGAKTFYLGLYETEKDAHAAFTAAKERVRQGLSPVSANKG